ncbi:hypothetical protein AGLY_016032, partial [Aphis glycines]
MSLKNFSKTLTQIDVSTYKPYGTSGRAYDMLLNKQKTSDWSFNKKLNGSILHLESKMLSSEEDVIQKSNGRQSRLFNIILFNLAEFNKKKIEEIILISISHDQQSNYLIKLIYSITYFFKNNYNPSQTGMYEVTRTHAHSMKELQQSKNKEENNIIIKYVQFQEYVCKNWNLEYYKSILNCLVTVSKELIKLIRQKKITHSNSKMLNNLDLYKKFKKCLLCL